MKILDRLRALESESGTVLVEFAIIAGTMILILGGIVDYGLYLQAQFQVQEAASAGAAYATIPGNQDMAISANSTGVQTAATKAQTGSVTSVTNFTVTPSNLFTCSPGGATVAYNATCTGYGTPIEYVQVKTQGKYATIFNVPGIPTSLTLTGSATYRVPWTIP